MGAIGKKLPKVLWPIFGKTLLENQLLFARKLGYEEIWINIHHQSEEILRVCSKSPSFEQVRWLKEEPAILDIGGAIQNVAQQQQVQYRGELLVLNADQFLWFTANELKDLRERAGSADVLLLNGLVHKEQGYNQVLSDEKRFFTKVILNKDILPHTEFETYSGNSLVRLESLDPTQTGVSNFFSTICNPSVRVCKTALLKSHRYWDFGTADRYWNSMQGILRSLKMGEKDPFVEFLIENGSLDTTLFFSDTLSYGTNIAKVINLGLTQVSSKQGPGVIMSGDAVPGGKQGVTLTYDGIIQDLS